MSDQEKTDTESTAEADTSSKATPAAAQAPAKSDSTSTGGKASSGVAWFAVLLVLALAGASGWVIMEGQRREAALTDRLAQLEATSSSLEATSASKDSRLEALGERLQGEFQSALGSVKAAAGGETSRLSKSLQTLEAQLAAQRKELARFSSADRDSWLIAEAEYLLRLANQRLIMAGDTEAAKALLNSADKVLRELDDTSLHAVRGAVAADLATVRAVPKVDVEGIYLRLAALVEQASALKIFELPEKEEQPEVEAAPDWRGRVTQGYEAARFKLSQYIKIRRRDVPMQTLMDPQWEGMVRQNLRMLLEQAQVALLSGNQKLYSESLERAQYWVKEFAETDEAASQAIARELRQLGSEQVAVAKPDLARSLNALDAAIERRLQQGGDE